MNDSFVDVPSSDDLVYDEAEEGYDTGPSVPEGVPEKFWDPETNEIRTDALLNSYQELERKMGSHGADLPPGADGYDISLSDSRFQVDPNLNERLHEAGFSQEQAQLVYDLATEHLSPVLNMVASQLQVRHEVERLNDQFGGAQKWGELSQQLATWGKAHLAPDVFAALSSSYDGVVAMHQMMTSGSTEPGLGRAEGAGRGQVSERKLKELMKDPRYWRDHDPAYAARIHKGFEELYPDEG